MKNKILIVVVLLVCSVYSKGVKKYEAKTKDTTQLYFPVNVMADTIEKMQDPSDTLLINSFAKDIDGYTSEFKNEWYSRHLKAMRADKLKNSKNEVIRFTWLRTFHKPISITIRKNGDKYTLRKIVLNGAGGYEPGLIEVDQENPISDIVWWESQKYLEGMKFWGMPFEDESRGLDGSEWILEASGAKPYHFVTEWTPRASPLKKFCERLIKLAYLRINKEDMY